MKHFKSQKAYLMIMLLLTVFSSSSLVYGESDKPGEAVPFEVNEDGTGTVSQGIISFVSGMSATVTAASLITGANNNGFTFTETPATARTTNGNVRTAKSQSDSGECQDSCSLN